MSFSRSLTVMVPTWAEESSGRGRGKLLLQVRWRGCRRWRVPEPMLRPAMLRRRAPARMQAPQPLPVLSRRGVCEAGAVWADSDARRERMREERR